MGAFWLNDLDQAIKSGGLEVVYYDNNWRTRSRSSGGYDGVWAVGYHHDASNPGSSAQAAADWAWKNSSDKPIGAMRLDRNCKVWLGAAGATNTMGKGGAIDTSHGRIPQDAGNKYMIAIEAGNSGVGEQWSKDMLDAYFALVAALCNWYDLDPNRDAYSHHWYCQPSCPGRKIDPAGPTPSYPDLGGTSGAKTWPVDVFRRYVVSATGGVTPPPTPEPEPPPTGRYTVVKGDSWWSISEKFDLTVDELVAANPPNTANSTIYPGQVLNIPSGSTPTPEPTPPPDTGGGYDWMASLPTIKKGQSGAYVERMQHLLAAAGFMDPGNTANYDGVWGSGTDGAKKKFDSAHGLASSNTDCGPKSWESLMTGKKW